MKKPPSHPRDLRVRPTRDGEEQERGGRYAGARGSRRRRWKGVAGRSAPCACHAGPARAPRPAGGAAATQAPSPPERPFSPPTFEVKAIAMPITPAGAAWVGAPLPAGHRRGVRPPAQRGGGGGGGERRRRRLRRPAAAAAAREMTLRDGCAETPGPRQGNCIAQSPYQRQQQRQAFYTHSTVAWNTG